MALFDLDSMLAKLLESPAIQDAVNGIKMVGDRFTKSMIRIDSRFDSVEAKLDKLIANGDGRFVSAGPDGLLEALAETSISDCPVVGCTNTAVHDHNDGNGAVQVKSNLLPFSTAAETKVS